MECLLCSEDISHKRADARYCSESCKTRMKYIRRKERSGTRCEECQRPAKAGGRFCSTACHHQNRSLFCSDGRRRCSKCGEKKPPDEFNYKNRQSGLLHSYCRSCDNAANKEWYAENRDAAKKRIYARKREVRAENISKLSKLKTDAGCIDCGYSGHAEALDFDHISGEKKDAVSRLASQGYSWEVLEEEIAKCEIRCANCHRLATRSRR